jgi:hypothetical protein
MGILDKYKRLTCNLLIIMNNAVFLFLSIYLQL